VVDWRSAGGWYEASLSNLSAPSLKRFNQRVFSGAKVHKESFNVVTQASYRTKSHLAAAEEKQNKAYLDAASVL
jgi:hypothetical protein